MEAGRRASGGVAGRAYDGSPGFYEEGLALQNRTEVRYTRASGLGNQAALNDWKEVIVTKESTRGYLDGVASKERWGPQVPQRTLKESRGGKR